MDAGKTTIIDLIRHGEPAGGARFRGSTDDPLSEAGWRQMAGAVGDRRWEAIVSSPALRCAAFAEALAGRLGIPLEWEARFLEIAFGEWEGRTAQELLQTAPQALERFWRDPERHTPPGGESLGAFAARVAAAWQELLDRHTGKHLLIITHAGVIRVVIGQVLQMPLGSLFRLDVPFAASTRVRIDGSGAGALPQLVFHGAAMNLEDPVK